MSQFMSRRGFWTRYVERLFESSPRLAELQNQVDMLRAQLEAERQERPRKNMFAIRAIVKLSSALEELIGGTFRDTRVDGQRLVGTLPPVYVTIDAFEQWLCLTPAVPVSTLIEPLRLKFDSEGHLSEAQVTMLLGFIARLTTSIPESEFWPQQASSAA